jgi:alpha-ribazole phosphatase/probable phosphoglycerate mutase
MAALVHLVRHAEVDNPDHLVCGSMPGFDLSPHGLEQARRVSRYLGPRAVVAIWSSPQQRALRTAEQIAARSGVPVRVHDDLTDWSLMDRWKGHPWNSISSWFPGELEAYLAHPDRLDFVDEPLSAVAERISAVARSLEAEHPHGDVIIVSHQDAIQAGRLHLTGGDLNSLHDDPPSDGAVISLRPGPAWKEETSWQPGDTPRFGERSDLRVVSTSGSPDTPAPA